VLDILKRTRVRQFALKIRHALPGEGDKPAFAKSSRPRPEGAGRSSHPASAEYSKKPAFRGEKKPAGEWKGKGSASSDLKTFSKKSKK
jgi:hypothetical protein